MAAKARVRRMQEHGSATPTPHEANYNLIAAALATAAATMLTLLATLGTTGSVLESAALKALLEAQLLVVEMALILSVISLVLRGEGTKRRLVLLSAVLVVLGTLLVWVSATMIILSV